MNSPIKLQITLTDACEAFREAIVYVCFASTALEEVVDSPHTANDVILQMSYQMTSCKTSVIDNRIPKYLLHPRIIDHQKSSHLLVRNISLLEWDICLCPIHGSRT